MLQQHPKKEKKGVELHVHLKFVIKLAVLFVLQTL